MNGALRPHDQKTRARASIAPFRGLGFSLLVLALGALFVLNTRTLWAMQSGVRAEQREAIEASRPANLDVTVILPTDCPRCYDASRLTNALRTNAGIKVLSEKTLNADAPEGQSLVTELAVTQLPAVVMRGEIDKTLTAAAYLTAYGQRSSDGRFVASLLPPPFVEAKTGKVRGLFEALYLTDKTCQECYDPTGHRTALANIGLVPATETTVDRRDKTGQALIKQYGIESVPTLLLRGDLAVYQNLQRIWAGVGTIETDGTFVFRTGQAQMGTYYDLKTKQLVKPESKQPEATPDK